MSKCYLIFDHDWGDVGDHDRICIRCGLLEVWPCRATSQPCSDPERHIGHSAGTQARIDAEGFLITDGGTMYGDMRRAKGSL